MYSADGVPGQDHEMLVQIMAANLPAMPHYIMKDDIGVESSVRFRAKEPGTPIEQITMWNFISTSSSTPNLYNVSTHRNNSDEKYLRCNFHNGVAYLGAKPMAWEVSDGLDGNVKLTSEVGVLSFEEGLPLEPGSRTRAVTGIVRCSPPETVKRDPAKALFALNLVPKT
jgi:hypothetical protein